MNLRRIRHLLVHTPRQLLARSARWSARSGWDHLLRRHAQLLRNLGIALGLLAAMTVMLVLITNTDDASPPATPPAVTTTTTPPTPNPTQPTTPNEPGPQPEPPVEPELATHTVRRGDTLAAIALLHGVPFEQLATDNRLANANRIQPGQRLSVRPPAAGVQVIRSGATLSSYAHQSGLSIAELTALNPHITDPDHIQAGGTLRLSAQAAR